jgi:hypothetical protein
MMEVREPTLQELRECREQVRSRHEELAFTEQRLQRGVVEEPERDALVLEWGASGQEELIRLIGWRAQALREEEDRLVERPDMRRAFDPLSILDAVIARLAREPDLPADEVCAELSYAATELRRRGSSVRVR